MPRALAAFAIATLCVLGAGGAGSAVAHDLPRSGAPEVHQATSIARVAAVAVPSPQPALSFLGGFAVIVATALAGAVMLGFVARQRRRPRLAPLLTSTVRWRGPPETRVHR
jgi:hypothetical protein